MVRMQLDAKSGYQANTPGATGTLDSSFIIIYKIVAGVPTQIGLPSVGVTPQVGDVFRLSVTGANPPTLTLYQNGFVILQVQDYSNGFLSGYPGMHTYTPSLADAQISLWGGGNANVIPAYPSGASSSWLTVALANSLRGLRH